MSILDESTAGRCRCVIGLQWGDEAKGKLVDLLSDRSDFVVRFNGGANAGHTVVRDGNTFKLSLLPTGVLRSHVTSVIGNGVVVNPVRFLEEVDNLKKANISVNGHLQLSDRAHVIFPYHFEEERLNEQREANTIGTTGRGIGPCYQDKAGRVCGIRVGELLYPNHLRERLRFVVERKNRLLRALSEKATVFDADEICDEYLGYAERMRPFIQDTGLTLQRAIKEKKKIVFEGAQGSLLDVDHGTYPYVTSSNSSTAGLWSGSGVSARNLDMVLGVVKAYTTRVGRGPFPTELDDGPDGLGEMIRQAGKEFGTVTGRPRRCGWLDTVTTRYTATLCGVDHLAIMLLDVLSGLPELKICTAYELDGERIEYFPVDAFVLERCKPVYESMPSWKEPIDTVRKLTDLPKQARQYLDRISEIHELPISVVSVGPDHGQTIFCD